MTEIALLRHFPTDWNRQGRLQGRIDRPLLPEARVQLAALALPPPWNATAILSSPLSRAFDTAHALARGRAVATDPRLVEIAWGEWEGRRQADLLAEPGSGFVATARLGWDERPPGGESKADAWTRVAPLLAELARTGQPTLIVSHKALMRAILRQAAQGGEPPEIKRGRLYPLRLDPAGAPQLLPGPLRLEPRA